MLRWIRFQLPNGEGRAHAGSSEPLQFPHLGHGLLELPQVDVRSGASGGVDQMPTCPDFEEVRAEMWRKVRKVEAVQGWKRVDLNFDGERPPEYPELRRGYEGGEFRWAKVYSRRVQGVGRE